MARAALGQWTVAVAQGGAFLLASVGVLQGLRKAATPGRPLGRLRRTRVASTSGSSEAVSAITAAESSGTVATVTDAVEPVVAASGGSATATLQRSFRRMWTAADFWHIHAVSGAAHTLIGLAFLLDVVAGDVAHLSGVEWTAHVPFDIVLASMFFGALNAVSGLQPALLPRPFDDLLQLLGIGEEGNLKSAGFINTAVFYFILTYQSARVLPAYPTWLEPFDPAFAALTFLSIWHAIFIINSWVGRGKLSQGFALGMSAPLLLNVPVSYHLFLEGQSWVEQLTAAYAGWPEVFFSSNYALAWAGSMVTLVLSLYERKVISISDRLIITVVIGAITFSVIPLRALVLVPQWFQGDWMVMLTLSPP